MCNRIRLAVALTQVTSKYINNTCCIVFVPFLFFIILIIWLAYWIILLVFLYTSGEFEKGKAKVFASFKMDEKLEYGFWFHIVMLFYITAIISAYSQFVYASHILNLYMLLVHVYGISILKNKQKIIQLLNLSIEVLDIILVL